MKKYNLAILKNNKIFSVSILMTVFIIITAIPITTKATQEINIETDKTEMLVDDNVVLTISSRDVPIASADIEIFFDESQFEFISGPELLDKKENSIKYSWFDEDGGVTEINNREIFSIVLKAKKEGIFQIGITGKAYDKNGNELNIEFKGVSLYIEKESNESYIQTQGTTSIDDRADNAFLQNLRLNEEGLEPQFEKDIFEYYIIVNENIQNLEVTAIPENINSTVYINGNTDLKLGNNDIRIEVISADKTKKNEYIIHVSKTKDIEKANTNLETLAIENASLEPEFEASATNYKVTVENNINQVNILAIPENINAKVSIEKDEELKIGDNIANITVLAEDGFSQKKYVVNIHRMNEEEQNEYERKQEENQKKLGELLSTSENNISVNKDMQISEKENNNTKKNITLIIIGIIFVIMVVLIAYLFRKKTIAKK